MSLWPRFRALALHLLMDPIRMDSCQNYPIHIGANSNFKQSAYLRAKTRPQAISSLHIFSQDFTSFHGISRTGRTQVWAINSLVKPRHRLGELSFLWLET